MIVLDTNVVSEMMRERPHPLVMAWADEAGPLHTTAITVAEIDHGIARLPAGRRKDELAAATARLFDDFNDVILAFDVDAARRYGEIVAGCERSGRPIAMADAQIAAICRSRRATLATRNTSDFEVTGTNLIDPWRGPAQ